MKHFELDEESVSSYGLTPKELECFRMRYKRERTASYKRAA